MAGIELRPEQVSGVTDGEYLEEQLALVDAAIASAPRGFTSTPSGFTSPRGELVKLKHAIERQIRNVETREGTRLHNDQLLSKGTRHA